MTATLGPNGTLLTGGWIFGGKTPVEDEVTQRIRELVEHHLVTIGDNRSGWSTLYRDPRDGRLWEFTYPYGEMQGGGPPQLEHIGRDEAIEKFGIDVVEGRSNRGPKPGNSA